MADFDMKAWLDSNVVPLINHSPVGHIYSHIFNGTPPKEILVWILAEGPKGPRCTRCSIFRASPFAGIDCKVPGCDFPPPNWPQLARSLLKNHDFRFDFLRDNAMVELSGSIISIFGCDGTPQISKNGMASVRLFKLIHGIKLILQVGHQYKTGLEAAAATKAFFEELGDNPGEVCQMYGSVFGAA